MALKEIDLVIEPGQTVGILGPNGSGKSTLLQVIAGIIHPTSGEVEIEGKISALLELGAGFNPEFTGRENVFLNASILGLSTEETEERFDAIVAFSGIGEFIDQPVKTYSSGMFVRLAFATAINVNPDIIIIDEALAVGDVAFQQRCMNKLRQLQKAGKTILFVSHDTSAVKSLCDHAILMQHGQIIAAGEPDDIVNQYMKIVYTNSLDGLEEGLADDLDEASQDELSPIVNYPTGDNRFGSKAAEIIGTTLIVEDKENEKTIYDTGILKVKVSVRYNEELKNPIIGFVLRDRLGNDITTTNTLLEKIKLPLGAVESVQTVLFELSVPKLLKGNYTISPAIANGDLVKHDMCDWIDNAYIFEVINKETVYGMMRVPVAIQTRLEG